MRAKSPTAESVARIRSPSPPKVRTPIKVQGHFKSPEPPSTTAAQLKSPEPPQIPRKLEPDLSEQEQNGVVGKSTVNGTANGIISLPGTSTNQMATTDDHGYTRKKVVKVVRRVVRKVLPSEDEINVPAKKSDKVTEVGKPATDTIKVAAAATSVSQTQVMPGFSFKHDVIKTEDKDDISRGLTSLMVRGRTRERFPRIFQDNRPEKMELDKISEKMDEKLDLKETTKEQNEGKAKPELQDVKHKSSSSSPVTKETTSSLVSVNPANKATVGSASDSSKSPHSRPLSFTPVMGFIPAPDFIPEPQSCFTASTSVNPNPPQPSVGPLSSTPIGIVSIQKPTVSQKEVRSNTWHVVLTFGTWCC